MLVEAPKFKPLAGMPPIVPGSVVKQRSARMPSSFATPATPSGMPMPRLTMLPGLSSSAARRAMILRSSMGIGSTPCAGTLISLLKAGL